MEQEVLIEEEEAIEKKEDQEEIEVEEDSEVIEVDLEEVALEEIEELEIIIKNHFAIQD